jgi:hypothetical protein
MPVNGERSTVNEKLLLPLAKPGRSDNHAPL